MAYTGQFTKFFILSLFNSCTVFRTHPLEGVVFIKGAFTQAISISLVFLFGPQVDIATILGANIFILRLMYRFKFKTLTYRY